MTLKLLLCSSAAVAALLLPNVVAPSAPQDAPKEKAAPQDADAAAAAAAGWARYMKLMEPSEHHDWFDRLLGDWTYTTTMTMGGAKTPLGSGKATFRRLFGKSWIALDYKGTLMNRPAEGLSIMGYDNYKKKYVFSDVSSQRTNMLTAEGMLDRAKTTLIFYGPMDEPVTDEHDKPVKYVIRATDPDRIVEEIHDLAIGETDTKVLEVVYVRAK
jgi:hypothetical protein